MDAAQQRPDGERRDLVCHSGHQRYTGRIFSRPAGELTCLRVVGCGLFDVRCSMFDVRCWMFDVRCSMLDVRCSMFDVRCWMFPLKVLFPSWEGQWVG